MSLVKTAKAKKTTKTAKAPRKAAAKTEAYVVVHVKYAYAAVVQATSAEKAVEAHFKDNFPRDTDLRVSKLADLAKAKVKTDVQVTIDKG